MATISTDLEEMLMFLFTCLDLIALHSAVYNFSYLTLNMYVSGWAAETTSPTADQRSML